MNKCISFSILIGAVFAFMLPAPIVCATYDNTDITMPGVIDTPIIELDGVNFDTVSGNEISDMMPDIEQPIVDLDDVDSSLSGNAIEFYPDIPDYTDDLQGIYAVLSDIVELSSYSAADGTIPEPYLSYVRGCLSWSGIHDNYVAFVSSYYLNNRTYTYYVCAVGDITYSSGSFTGSDVDVYTFYPNVTTSSGTNYRHDLQSSFSYSPNGYLCFTDLSSDFPDLRTQDTKYLFVLVTVCAAAIIFYTVTKFGFGKVNFRRRYKRG